MRVKNNWRSASGLVESACHCHELTLIRQCYFLVAVRARLFCGFFSFACQYYFRMFHLFSRTAIYPYSQQAKFGRKNPSSQLWVELDDVQINEHSSYTPSGRLPRNPKYSNNLIARSADSLVLERFLILPPGSLNIRTEAKFDLTLYAPCHSRQR